MYTCSSCSSGQMLEGICISDSITPTSGQAGVTSFSLSSSGIDLANALINEELNRDRNGKAITVTSLKIKYPGGAEEATITSPLKFTIPKSTSA